MRKRKNYTKNDVNRLRKNRSRLVPKNGTLTTEQYQQHLGDLRAAGHLRIYGAQVKKVLADSYSDDDGNVHISDTYNLKFSTGHLQTNGERPHMFGYLESVHESDKTYRIHGWLNDDGTIRIELVV